MATIDTSHTLMNVGACLQIPFSLFQIAIGSWLLWLLYPVLADPIFWTTFRWWTALLLGFIIVGGVLGLFLAVFGYFGEKISSATRKATLPVA